MELKEKFLEYIRTERRLSPRTVDTYSECLKIFQGYLRSVDDKRELENIDTETIREWMEWLMERGRSAAYVNKCLAAIKTFFRFCLSQGYLTVDPAHALRGPKKEKRLPSFLKESELDRLFEIMSRGDDEDIDQVRSRTIIYMFYITGLRAAELISLDDSMVDFVTKEIKVTGKRNKQRVIPFGTEMYEMLSDYIQLRDRCIERIPEDADALFVTNKGKRISYSQVRKLVNDNLSLVTSAKKRSPHVLRHTFATTMLNHEASLEAIKKLLGHQSLDTTEIYTHTTFEKLKEVYNEAHPRAETLESRGEHNKAGSK